MVITLVLLTTSALLAAVCLYQRRNLVRLKSRMDNFSQDSQIAEVEIERLKVFRKVVETSPQLFIMVDQGQQVIVANQTALIYGWMKNHSFMDAQISDTSKLHFTVELQRVLTDGASTDGEIRLARKKDGKWAYFIYHIFPVRDEQEVIVGAAVTALDITAQREAEDELHREREFIEGIMNAIPDPIYVKNDHHQWIYGNRAFSEMVGKRPSEYLGHKEDDILSAQNARWIKRLDRDVLRSGTSDESEEEIYDSKGQKRIVLSKRTPFTFQDGRKVLISVMRDISERKKLELELQVSKARQLEASRLATLGETAGGIAHEINNPLNVLVGIAELIQMLVDKNGTIEPSKLKEYSEKIVKFSMRIAKIVKGLRAISRDASQDPFSDVELGQLVEEAVELCRQQFLNRGIELTVKNPDRDLIIQGRFAQISQIVMNILNNARDAVEESTKPQIYVEVTRDTNDQAVIRIWDSGPGIPQEIESQIMNPFFTTKPAGKGTGLGLSISRAIADEHGGVIRLNRNVSASCFEVILPLNKENQDILKQAA